MKKTLTTVLGIFFFAAASAQTVCPVSITAQKPTCSCSFLTADYVHTAATTSYTVTQLPYAPDTFTLGTTIALNADDIWSGVINLPFNFCFFDMVYNQVVIGTNGIITFDVSQAAAFCPYAMLPGDTIPSNTHPTNSIMVFYQDIDPTYVGTIRYRIAGVAPCRRLVVTYYHIPYFGDPNSISTGICTDPLDATGQIILYETTNIIDVHIQNKDVCAGWNDGLAIEGIQDTSGTMGYAVPGRNDTVWTAQNDSWRFEPAGPQTASVTWYVGPIGIALGDTLTACPDSVTTYTLVVAYNSCAGGGTGVVADSITLYPPGDPISLSFTHTDATCSGCANGSATVSIAGGTPPYSVIWNTAPVQTTTTAAVLYPGIYIACITDANNCTACDTVEVLDLTAGISKPTTSSENIYFFPNPFSDFTTLTLDKSLTARNAQCIISDVSGRVIRKQNITGNQIIIHKNNLADGVYFFSIVSEDGVVARGKMVAGD